MARMDVGYPAVPLPAGCACGGAAMVVVNMLVALGLVHLAGLFVMTPQGGWALELQGLYLFGALAVALLGAGRYSVLPPSRAN